MTRWVAVFVALAAAFAWPMQGPGDNENSHYALVKSLASGTATVDRTRREVGDRGTIDVAVHRGHYYSNKAPGLAFLLVPPYVALRAAGVSTTGDPTRMLWALGIVGTVLPTLLLAWLVARAGDWIEPGFGVAAASALALGTLALPFATVLHAHALAALLAFAAFVVLWSRGGEVRPRLWWIAAGGALAGLAVTVEYANAITALVLLGYAAAREHRARRAVAYAAGVGAGVLPLAVYNAWAFGSPFHMSYSNALPTHGSSTGELIGGFEPSLGVLLETLFSTTGLLVLSPVLVLAGVGAVLMLRGHRLEALAVAAVTAGFVVYNSSFGSELDAYPGGQRYLIPMLGFTALALAPALRRLPTAGLGLGIVSAVLMVALTASHVRSGDPDWLGPLVDRRFPRAAPELLGVTGWYGFLPFFVAVLAAAAAAFLATGRPDVSRAETVVGAAAVLAWAAVAAVSPSPLASDSERITAYLPHLAVLLCVAALVVVVRRPRSARYARWLRPVARGNVSPDGVQRPPP